MAKKYVVCVTGVAGFIGRHFLDRLLWLDNCYIYGIDNLSYASRKFPDVELWAQKDKIRFIKADIATMDRLPDCDILVNFAAETHVDNSIESSDAFIHSNVEGVHNLLKLVAKKPAQERPLFVQVSTDEVYGDILDGGLHKETDPLKPSNPYSASKAAGDLLIMAWARTHGVRYNIVRPTNNYGIGQHPEKLIPKTIQYYSIGKKIPLHDKGKPIRNWIHARDTATGIWTVITKGTDNEIYNIPGNWEISNYKLVEKLLCMMKGKKTIETNEFRQHVDFSYARPGQDLRYGLDGSKLAKLGWEPTGKPDTILKAMIKESKNKFQWSI